MKQLRISFAVLALNFAAQAVCQIPQYETCRAEDGTTAYANCLVRNRQEEARYQRCFQQEHQERERERQEQERERREQERERKQQQHENYCHQHPDAAQCQ
jgi:hypothetical protein